MILPRLKEMDNNQLYNFTREQTQVFLTGLLGDGCISTTNSGSYIYTTNCKHLEYLEFKKKLLGKGNINLSTMEYNGEVYEANIHSRDFPFLENVPSQVFRAEHNRVAHLSYYYSYQ